MTLPEIRTLLARLDGPQCGAAWEGGYDEDGPIPGGICDLPAGHDGPHGADQDRCDPWFAALAEELFDQC